MDNELDLKILQVEPSKDWQDRTLARLKLLRDQPATQKKQRNYVKFALPFGILAFSTVLVITVLLNPNLVKQEQVLPEDNIDSILTSIKYPFEIADTTQMLGGSTATLDDRTMIAAPLETAVPETTDSLEFTEFDDYTTKLDTSNNEATIVNEEEAITTNTLEKTLPVVESNLIRISRIDYSYGPASCSMVDQGFRENRSITKLRITGEKNIFAEIEEKTKSEDIVENNITLQVINEKGSQFYTKSFDGLVDSYELENIFEVWNQAFYINHPSISSSASIIAENDKWNIYQIKDTIQVECNNSQVNNDSLENVDVTYSVDRNSYEIKFRNFSINGRTILNEDYFAYEFDYSNLVEDWNKINKEWAFGDLINGIVSDLDGFIEKNFEDNKDKTN